MKEREYWGFAGPSAIVMAALLIVPLAMTTVLSLDQVFLGGHAHYVGLANYIALYQDPRFWHSIGFTVLYVLVSVPVHTAVGFALALALERVSAHWRAVLIGCYALPFVLTPVVGTLIFSWLFKEYWGLIPYGLSLVGVHVSWFSDTGPARLLIIAWGVWWTFGFNTMVLYSGLQSLPEEPMRAAKVDGATYWQRTRYLVIPHLASYFVLITLFNIIDGLRVFDSIWVITQGGPGDATESLAYLTYHTAFVLQDLGRGSALCIVSVLLTFVVLAPFLLRLRTPEWGDVTVSGGA